MNFHILTLFPEMVMDGLSTSIIGRAMNANILFGRVGLSTLAHKIS